MHPAHHSLLRRGRLILSLLALGSLYIVLVVGHASAARVAGKYECQHPFTTGEFAVDLKGVGPKEACRVVRSLARFESDDVRQAELYECRGASKSHPGRPALKMTEFKGWRLRLANSYGLVMSKPGRSFRILGQDFPINCS